MTTHPLSQDLIPQMQRSTKSVLSPLQRQINRFFDEVGEGWTSLTNWSIAPSIDVVDTEAGVEVSIELPGMSRDDVKISVEGDLLTISGEKKAEEEHTGRNFRVLERSYGEFARSVYLPHTVDAEKITALMKDGVLKITAPKRAGADAKKIEIQSA